MARNAEAADKGDKFSDEIPNCKRWWWENDPCVWTSGINDKTFTPRDEGLELNPWRRAMAPGPETKKKCAHTSLRSGQPPKSRQRRITKGRHALTGASATGSCGQQGSRAESTVTRREPKSARAGGDRKSECTGHARPQCWPEEKLE
jgi:hypothetical protein